MVLAGTTPSIGNRNIGIRAVTGIGRASVSHSIAMTTTAYAHLDSYKHSVKSLDIVSVSILVCQKIPCRKHPYATCLTNRSK